MPALLPGQIAMEKTPGYFHTPGVARRLWEANNMTKLVTIIIFIITIILIITMTMQVLIIRNPVDRMISDYNQFRSRHLDRGQVDTYLHIYISTYLHIITSTHLHIYVSTRTTRRWSTSSSPQTVTSTSGTNLCSAASTTTTLSGNCWTE